MTHPESPRSERVALVVTTVGRWSSLEHLLGSLERSSVKPAAVAVANQSGEPAPPSLTRNARVEVVDSSGGISRGRNDALDLLDGTADLLSFPNDNCTLRPDTLERALARHVASGWPAAFAGTLAEPSGARFVLPPSGTRLTRWTVWRAIEPAMFVTAPAAKAFRFRPDLGSGSDGPWQAGEGTDLLLRLLAAGRPVVAAPEVVIEGPGQRRALTTDEFRLKLRSYARGTGYVLRLHQAGVVETALQVALPWYRWLPRGSGSTERTTARDCATQSLGRLEGRLGRCSGGGRRLNDAALAK